MNTLASQQQRHQTQLQLPQPSNGFHFPKWYTDYLRANSHSSTEAGVGFQNYRLSFLQQDGTEAEPEPRKSHDARAADSIRQRQHQQFPTLRQARVPSNKSARGPSNKSASSGGQHQQPLLPTVVALGKQQRQQRNGSNLGGVEKYNSFVAMGVPAHPALYSSIRAQVGGRRLCVNQHAGATIPSVDSIRQHFRLPPIMIKKLV